MKRYYLHHSDPDLHMFISFLYLTVKRKRRMAIVYLFIMVVCCSGCFMNFYNTNTKRSLDDAALTSLNEKEKYVIVHLKNGNYSLKNFKVNNNLLEADLDSVSSEHARYMRPRAGKAPSYKKKYERSVLTEIHMYAEGTTGQDNHLSVPLSSFSRIDVYEKDISKTTINHVMSIIGVVAGSLYITGIIVLAIACNCPQVYTYDAGHYEFRSGVFSGAIYSSLEKTDYLPLDDLNAVNGKFLLRLMNNQQEEQHVNQFNLIQVIHDSSTKVLMDRHGKIHTYNQPYPASATSLREDVPGQTLRARDGDSYVFNQKGDSASSFGTVILTFDKPAVSKQAKLIIRAKNSLWSGYVFDEFSALFGRQYQKFIARQDKKEVQEIERWQKEQALPLMAYIETETGWQLIDYFALTGNTAARDMVMELTLPNTRRNEVRIKLESAYMFWDLDYAAIDYSADIDLKTNYLSPSKAYKLNDKAANQVPAVANRDNEYVTLLQNELIDTEFEEPATPATRESSYFLMSRGYYHSLKQYPGKADLIKLNQFRKKAAFTAFSERKFAEAQTMIAKGVDLRGNKY